MFAGSWAPLWAHKSLFPVPGEPFSCLQAEEGQVLLGLLLHNCLQLKVTFMSKWHVWGATVWCFFNTKGTNLEKAETAVAGSLG